MGFIPHPPIPLSHVYVTDIFLVLCLATIVTFLHRVILYLYCNRPHAIQSTTLRNELRSLQHQTVKLRRKGPATFVETSKMERQVLAKEKQLGQLQERHEVVIARIRKWHSRCNYVLCGLIVIWYYKTPLIRIHHDYMDFNVSSSSRDGDNKGGQSFWRGMAFPLSVMGLSMRIASFGTGNGGIGALVIYFAGQVTIDKVMDCIHALL